MAEADPKIETETPAPLAPAFAVRLSALLAVKPFISTELTRYYLNGVYVEPCPKGGALCVATDGHKLGVKRDPEGLVASPKIVTLPAVFKMPSARDMKLNVGRSPWVVCMASETGRLRGHLSLVPPLKGRDDDTAERAIERVEECELRYGPAIIDGSFPDWRRVIPAENDKDVTRSFNAANLKVFGSYFTMTGADERAPHLVRTTDRDFLGVVMPMSMIDAPRPDWLTA